MNFIEVYRIDENIKSLSKSVQGGFDNPKPSLVAKKILFSGWFLAEDREMYIRVDFSREKSSKFYLDYPRPDVVRYFSLSPEKEVCGFYFQIDVQDIECDQPANVFVVLGEDIFHVFSLKKIELLDQKTREIGELWQSILSHKKPSIFNAKTDLFSQYNMADMVDIRFDVNVVFEVLAQTKNNPFLQLNSFKEFVELFKNEYWSMQAIEQASKNKTLEYNSVCGGQNLSYFCIRSYCVDDVNFLLFKMKDVDFYFYIGQYNCNVAILFPSIPIGLSFVPNDLQGWVDTIQDKLNRLIKYTVKYPTDDVLGKFLGANLTQSRPYHTVHDLLHGLEFLHTRQQSTFDVVSNKNFGFIDPAQIFSNINSFNALAEQKINSLSCINHGFYIMPCLRYQCSGYDRNLISLANILNLKINQPFPLLETKDIDLIFWIGISVERRIWKEQIVGLLNIINLLSQKFNLCVLIDGYTCTLNSDTGTPINKEKKIFETIKRNAPKSVTFISLIGKTMTEKIAWSAKIDIFLTHYLTDSMYVSAIQKKHGVTYCSPYTPNSDWVIHSENMIEVPNVKSINPEKTYYEQSVSMNWQDVYACIEQTLKKIGK